MRMILLALTTALSMGAQSLDHSAWDAILKQHTTPKARVNYAAIKKDSAALDQYLKQLAAPWPSDQGKMERKTALINAYNALTVRWIVTHYPVKSIWKTPSPFRGSRHEVDGKKVSLDAIEKELRQMGDPRIHSAVICASIGCPPLRREAFEAARLEAQLESQMKDWLSSPERNRFDPAKKTAYLSMIFKWYGGDFKETGVPAFVARYVPEAEFLKSPKAKIEYLRYDWGLNDSAGTGAGYEEAEFLADQKKNEQ